MRRLLPILVLLFSLPVVAGLHPGWSENGWLTGLSTAQQQARESKRPIFLYFDAIWCSWCQQYKRTTLDKPSVRKKLGRYYVPLVIDYDAEPGLFNKLGGRGLPFTVILSPEGEVLNRFVGVLSEADLLATLDLFRHRQAPAATLADSLFEPVRVTAVDAKSYNAFRRAFLRHVESLYSEEEKTLSGQYDTGITLKRPSPLTWMWLMQQSGWRQRATIAARVEADRLADPVGGGFFQYLQVRPGKPDYLESSKLLEVNARLSQWIARTGRNNHELLPVARAGVDYLLSTLHDDTTGAFFQAQVADQDYYQLPADRRKSPPPIDRVIRMDTNAQAIIALVDLSQRLDDRALLSPATRAYDFLLTGMVRNGRYYHLYETNELKAPAELSDLVWLYAAGLELQQQQVDNQRRRRLLVLARLLHSRIDQLTQGESASYIGPELYGLIAWIATHPGRNRDVAGIPGKAQARWALQQMVLEPDTPPDTLIHGLVAWERLLEPHQ